jgi:hypothetical protein
MSNRLSNHLSDEQILCLIDGETPAEQAAAERQHLADCSECEAREAYLRSSLAEIVGLLNPIPDAALSDAIGARARLRAQLRQASRPQREGWLRRLEVAMYGQRRILLYAELAVMVLAVCLITWRGVAIVNGLSGDNETRFEPNHMLTPGATRPVTLAEICPLDNDNDLDPEVTPSKRKAVFEAYGIKSRTVGKDYQVDYLINPQLGGTDDIKNLWPEPYGSVWNAHAKDSLEKRLHQMVCERQIDLESAQRDIASDWIAAYKKYFHSEKPLTTTAAFLSSLPPPDSAPEN